MTSFIDVFISSMCHIIIWQALLEWCVPIWCGVVAGCATGVMERCGRSARSARSASGGGGEAGAGGEGESSEMTPHAAPGTPGDR